jgi:hypothetical protein
LAQLQKKERKTVFVERSRTLEYQFITILQALFFTILPALYIYDFTSVASLCTSLHALKIYVQVYKLCNFTTLQALLAQPQGKCLLLFASYIH